MKYFFFILIGFIMLSFCASTRHIDAYGGQLIYQIKDASHQFGTIIYKNSNYKANQPCVVVLHAIGERGSGSLTDLRRLIGFPAFTTLLQAADVFGFNITFVQTSNEYELGEIPYAYQTALLSLQADPNSMHLLAHSLGGFGLLRNGPALSMYATATLSASGPGLNATSAQRVAAARQVWLFTSATDTQNGTNPGVTDTLYARLSALGANVYETKYNNFTHNGVLSGFIAAFGQAPNNWLPVGASIATGFSSPKTSWYGWIMNNHLVGPVKSPSISYIPNVVQGPIPPIIIHDTLKITIQLPTVHDTLWVEHPVVPVSSWRVFSDGSIVQDSLLVK
ncbi:MAG: hypothetical protein H0X41_07945 [Chitinophagaceae bacterium]|nr:hypothetical protein [Chitinophagaceae bacterium]